MKLLPGGGPQSITIDDASRYDRITGLVINADTSATRDSFGDWNYHREGQAISARASADFTQPFVRHRRPVRGTHAASQHARVTISFSDRMFTLTSKTVKLVDAKGHAVKTRLALTTNGRKRSAGAGANKAVLTPAKPLRKNARYEVRLGRDLRDFGGNALRPSALTWSFTTHR